MREECSQRQQTRERVMIRSKLVFAWYTRFMRRDDAALRRFDSLRIDQPVGAVRVFYAHKAN
jgi:hypothetical protein